jgi:dUTP diphosphatase
MAKINKETKATDQKEEVLLGGSEQGSEAQQSGPQAGSEGSQPTPQQPPVPNPHPQQPPKAKAPEDTLRVFKEMPGAFLPKRANANDAGVDFFLPVLTDGYKEILEEANPDISVARSIQGGFALSDEYASKMTEEQRQAYVQEAQHFLMIPAGSHIILPLGVRVATPKGTAMMLQNKSGIATKLSLAVGANVIDEGYRGTVKLHLYNFSTVPAKLVFGMKIVQGVIYKMNYEAVSEVSEEEFKGIAGGTTRGEGGFGSTGL